MHRAGYDYPQAGAIVKGYAFRPPLEIEIRIDSGQLVAANME
jgi:hypothetical protein